MTQFAYFSPLEPFSAKDPVREWHGLFNLPSSPANTQTFPQFYQPDLSFEAAYSLKQFTRWVKTLLIFHRHVLCNVRPGDYCGNKQQVNWSIDRTGVGNKKKHRLFCTSRLHRHIFCNIHPGEYTSDGYVYAFMLLSAKLCFSIYISFATFIKANKAATMTSLHRLQTKKRGLHVEADSYVHNMFSTSTPFAIKTTTNTSIVFKYRPSRLNNNFRYSPQSSYI